MNAPPFASFIIPIRNEADSIERCIVSVMNLDYSPTRLEVLIVDGMSTDDTRKVICEVSSRYPERQIRVLDNPGKIVSIGMNIALRQAKGDVIVRVDGHTMIAADYVQKCVEALQRTQADNVGGKMNAIGGNPFGRAVALATSMPFGVGGARFHYSDKEEWVDTVYMGAWPRRVFEKNGLFDEELVRDQDDEFNYRLREQGGRILLSPAIRSEYIARSTPSALWRQYYQYGFWKVRVLQKHPRQMSIRQFVPPVFVLALLFSLMLAFFPVPHSLFVFVPLAYLFSNLSASLWIASRRSWTSLLCLPLIFAILHLSYGLGFWAGLLKFAFRWGDKTGKAPVWSNETAE